MDSGGKGISSAELQSRYQCSYLCNERCIALHPCSTLSLDTGVVAYEHRYRVQMLKPTRLKEAALRMN